MFCFCQNTIWTYCCLLFIVYYSFHSNRLTANKHTSWRIWSLPVNCVYWGLNPKTFHRESNALTTRLLCSFFQFGHYSCEIFKEILLRQCSGLYQLSTTECLEPCSANTSLLSRASPQERNDLVHRRARLLSTPSAPSNTPAYISQQSLVNDS